MEIRVANPNKLGNILDWHFSFQFYLERIQGIVFWTIECFRRWSNISLTDVLVHNLEREIRGSGVMRLKGPHGVNKPWFWRVKSRTFWTMLLYLEHRKPPKVNSFEGQNSFCCLWSGMYIKNSFQLFHRHTSLTRVKMLTASIYQMQHVGTGQWGGLLKSASFCT